MLDSFFFFFVIYFNKEVGWFFFASQNKISKRLVTQKKNKGKKMESYQPQYTLLLNFLVLFLKIEKQQNEIFYISCQRDKILNNVRIYIKKGKK